MEIEGDVKNLNRRKRAENLTPVLFLLLFIVLCCILIPFNVSAENIPEVVTLPEFPYIDVIAINQKSFCDYVREKNFENALKIINDYIQSLSSQYNPDDHLYHGYKKEVNVRAFREICSRLIQADLKVIQKISSPTNSL